MNLQELEQELEMAYTRLENAARNYRIEAENVRVQEYDLKKDILDAYAENRISGKNQTERDAAERSIFAVQFDELELSRENEAEAYMEKELAEIKVRCLHDILRIKELAQVTRE